MYRNGRCYPKLIEEFMPSEEMKEYLKNVKLEYWQIVQLVYLSPTTIAKKKKALEYLICIAEQEHDEALKSECQLYLRNIEDSAKERAGEGVFTVKLGRYNREEKDTAIDFETVCTTYDAALSVIAESNKTAEYADDEPVWYEVTKWNNAENGKMKETCSYFIVRGELWYVNMDDSYYDKYLDSVHLYFEMENLNVPVPFLPGDILEIDGYPFGPVQHILITSVGDNCDCCCVQALSINDERKWTCGAVKHGMVGYRYFPKLSPLYNAKIYESDFDEEEALLSVIRDYISGDRSKAQRIYDCSFDEVTEEEVWHFIEMDFDRNKVEKYLRMRNLINH